MKQRSILNSPRLIEIKKKKRKILLRKILLILFLIVLLIVGLSFLSRWEKLNISTIEISGNKVIDKETVEEIVKEKLSGHYFYFFPKTNFLLYPNKEIKIELENRFKRVSEVSIHIKNLKTLDISIVERKALYTYCGKEINKDEFVISSNIDSSEKCYFLDESGYIFDEAPYFSGEVYLKFYGRVNGVEQDTSPSGKYYFEPHFKKLVSLKETFKKIDIKPTIFYIDEKSDVRMYLSSSVSKIGPEIIFKIDSDYNQVVENLQSVLSTEPLQSDFKNKYSSLLYIDLRFGNKVYYKFK